MKMVIWKVVLEVTDRQVLMIPYGAQILSVQMLRGVCCLWVLCDQSAVTEARTIAMYGTGGPLPDDPGEYMATFQMNGGDVVFHVFEIF